MVVRAEETRTGVEERTHSAASVRRISKSYGNTKALRDVSFDVTTGTIHALLGGNGSGKSTLIRILAGVVKADAGELEIGGVAYDARSQTPARARAVGLHFVHQQNSTFPDMTVAENLAIGRGFETGFAGRIRWSAVRRRAADVLERFGIAESPDTRIGALSAASQMMVAIARALQDQEGERDGMLVLDEPTASLPRHEVDVLVAALQRYAQMGQTILYVTHRLEEVTRVASRATVLRNGSLAAEFERAEFSHDVLVRAIMGENTDPVPDSTRVRRAVASSVGQTTLAIRAAGPDGEDLVFRPGEIVGVAGLLGSGRSWLLRSLFGLHPEAELRTEIDGVAVHLTDPRRAMAAGVAYVPEDRHGHALFSDLGVAENLSIATLPTYSRRFSFDGRAERAAARNLISEFGIRAASERSLLTSLSGGNQQKVVLARWLQRRPRVLLLDEPTQGVDVGARLEIHKLIRRAAENGAIVLLVCSEFDELIAVADRVVVMRDRRIVADVSGGTLTMRRLNTLVYSQEATVS
jgi:ribose transport system ATP-binding protein